MRYAVFAGLNYYPDGGWNDFVGFVECDTGDLTDVPVKRVVSLLKLLPHPYGLDWAHYVNLETGAVSELSNVEIEALREKRRAAYEVATTSGWREIG